MSTSGKPENGVGSFGAERPHADFHFWWFVTRRCGNACRHCLRHGIGDRGAEFDAPTARRLLTAWIDWLRRNGKTSSLAFGGADPVCRTDLPDLLRICRDAAAEGLFARPIGILANPHGVDLAYARLMFDCGIRHFTVSLDGLKETNDALRGPGDFDAAVRGMDVLQQAGLQVAVKFTALRTNIGEFAAVRELARAHGVDCVVPGRLILEGGGLACANLALSEAEWQAFLRENQVKASPCPPPRRASADASRPLRTRRRGHFVILAGGEFRPDRRGPALGAWPQDSFASLLPRLAEFESGGFADGENGGEGIPI